MSRMKRQKAITLKNEHPSSVDVQYATRKDREIASERMKRLNQSGNDTQLWMCQVVNVKSDTIKNIA